MRYNYFLKETKHGFADICKGGKHNPANEIISSAKTFTDDAETEIISSSDKKTFTNEVKRNNFVSLKNIYRRCC